MRKKSQDCGQYQKKTIKIKTGFMIGTILRRAVIFSFLSFLTGCRYYSIPAAEAERLNQLETDLLKENQKLEEEIKNLKENPQNIDYRKLVKEKYPYLKCPICKKLYEAAEKCYRKEREGNCPNRYFWKIEDNNNKYLKISIEMSDYKPEDKTQGA